MEQYENEAELPPSFVTIPINIDIEALEQSIDKDLKGVIYEDKDLNDGDATAMKLVKDGRIEIQADTSQLNYQLPLRVDLKYNAGFTTVEGKGKILLDFQTKYNIDPDWSIQTFTSLSTYDWIEKPKIRVAGINLNIGFLGNLIVDNTKKVITRTIDELIKDNLMLNERISEIWDQLQSPILLSEEYSTWLIANPKDIGMSPIMTNNRSIVSSIHVETRPAVFIGPEPQTVGTTLLPVPSFKFTPQQTDEFELRISAEVTYEEAERLAKVEMQGETYDYGSRTFTVEDIKLYGQNDKLIINTQLSGSYTGNIYLEGTPVYDERENTIKIDDLKYTLKTKNFLFKTAGWLLKSTFKNRIQDTLDFYLETNLEEAKNQFKQQLAGYSITNGVQLNGDLNQLQIQDARLTPTGMTVDIMMNGKLNLDIKGLN